jgi:hypothetical protein
MTDINSYAYRNGKQKLDTITGKLLDICMELGESIDPQGYDDGDYTTAIAKIKALVVETLKDEPIPEREDWYADHEGRKTLYNNATARIKARTRNDLRGEIRSIFE